MKYIKISFLSLLLMIFALLPATAMAIETDSTAFSVNPTVQEDTLRLEIKGIPTENPRQMLSVLVIHRNADMAQPNPEDILYANTLYLNGRTTLDLDINTGGRDARVYRLIIGDSTGAVTYSELLGPADYEPNPPDPSEPTPPGTGSEAQNPTSPGTGSEAQNPTSPGTGSEAQNPTSPGTGQTTVPDQESPETGDASPAVLTMLAVTMLIAAGGLITIIIFWNKRRIDGGVK